MKNPFIAGNWVRGETFFGRNELLDEILEGRRNYLWIAGTRRFGKTSLLKQLELQTCEGEHASKYISLFWDMQGSQDLDGLKESILLSIEFARKRFEAIGIDINELEEKDLFGILRTLRRKAEDASLNLMLLCDETEELINVEKNNPEVLPKLRRFFQSGDSVYTILMATRRLSVLGNASSKNTSPFLHGFVPPVYLKPLQAGPARKLINQWDFNEAQVEEILDKTANHPYLIQLICLRLIESGDLKNVMEEVIHDSIISNFFSVDFQSLVEEEKTILLHLLQNRQLSLEELQSLIGTPIGKLTELLYDLSKLGVIKQVDAHYLISNYFFEKWLEREKQRLYTDSDLKRVAPTATFFLQSDEVVRLPKVGESLGGHEILEKIGSGGMGVVLKARDLRLNRIVALKILLPELMADTDFKERFILEAQTASSLNHPNITTIYQVGEDRDIMFISMEFVEGETLRKWCQKHHSLAEKLQVAIEAGNGIRRAHKKGIIHRDIKSDNIMVSNEGIAKVMDFGLAKTQKANDKHLTKTGTTLGTLAYMSPEQARGEALDQRSDIFSFAIVLYELFTGKLPFVSDYEPAGILYAIMQEEPEPFAQVNPELPENLETIVFKALKKDKEERYQSTDELIKDLQGIEMESCES